MVSLFTLAVTTPLRSIGIRKVRILCFTAVLILRIGAAAGQTVGNEEREARRDRKLSVYMNKYPDADANGDGILTIEERDAHRQQMILEKFSPGATNFSVVVSMRDGVKLATEVFLPPGDGPWPVVLTRSVYGRWSTALRDVGLFGKHGVAFVTQDLRGIGDSEGRDTFDPFSFDNESGNVWKNAHAWPLPHTPTPFYLAPDGGLSRERSDTPDANRSYIYSPANPIPTMGGAMMGSPGPVDQRPLADRSDILRFISGPLPEPLEVKYEKN